MMQDARGIVHALRAKTHDLYVFALQPVPGIDDADETTSADQDAAGWVRVVARCGKAIKHHALLHDRRSSGTITCLGCLGA